MELSDIWTTKQTQQSYAKTEPQQDFEENLLVCEYHPTGEWKFITHVTKESKPLINAYDTEHHLQNLWGIRQGINEYGNDFKSEQNPSEIRLSSNEEAKDFLSSVRQQDWFKAAFHPLLTGLDFDVRPSSHMQAAAHFNGKRKLLTLKPEGFTPCPACGGTKPENSYEFTDCKNCNGRGEIRGRLVPNSDFLGKDLQTLFDPSSEEPLVHSPKCKCKGSNRLCYGSDSAYCSKPYPCKLHSPPGSSNWYDCEAHTILLQGNKIINPIIEGVIEYGKTTGFSRSKPVLLHELAHVVSPFGLTPAKQHGPEFLGTYSYIIRNVLGEESYEALRRGIRDQVRPRSLDAFTLDAIPSDFADGVKEDNAAIKNQKRILTPQRQRAIEIERQKRERVKKRKEDPLSWFFPDF